MPAQKRFRVELRFETAFHEIVVNAKSEFDVARIIDRLDPAKLFNFVGAEIEVSITDCDEVEPESQERALSEADLRQLRS